MLTRSIALDSDTELFDLVQDSLSAAQDGAELTKRLLAFSRKAPLKRKRIDLHAFLSHFQRFLRRTLGSGVAISVDVEADFDYLPCDPHQLENALLNLALNARDAMPEGGRIRIRARSKQAADLDPTLEPGKYAELSVIDTGTGMNAEQLSRAIEALQSDSVIELVFSDIVMPGEVNGDDLYLWVKAHRPEVKVLLTTGLRSAEVRALTDDSESPVPIGLPKPYTKEQLAEAIRDVFAG